MTPLPSTVDLPTNTPKKASGRAHRTEINSEEEHNTRKQPVHDEHGRAARPTPSAPPTGERQEQAPEKVKANVDDTALVSDEASGAKMMPDQPLIDLVFDALYEKLHYQEDMIYLDDLQELFATLVDEAVDTWTACGIFDVDQEGLITLTSPISLPRRGWQHIWEKVEETESEGEASELD